MCIYIYIYIYIYTCKYHTNVMPGCLAALGHGRMGRTLMAKALNSAGLEKTCPGMFGEIHLTGVPKKSLCQKNM